MIKVLVTAEHVRNGLRSDCQKCPIALALSEVFDDVTVEDQDTIWIGSTKTYVYGKDDSEMVSDFIDAFDSGKLNADAFEGITFEIEEEEPDGGEY